MKLSKNDSLALKGIAILMMYIHHFYLSPERWAGYTVDFFPLTEGITVYIASFFKICVSMFVFLTGYGLATSFAQKYPLGDSSCSDQLHFVWKRLVSLLSNFIFVYLLVILVSFPTGRFFEIYGKSSSSPLYVLLDLLGLAQLFHTPTYVGTWWYMSLAIVLVVLFPLFNKLCRNYQWLFILGVLLFPRFLGLKIAKTNLLHWTLAMALGIYCAQTDLFTRWKTLGETYLKKIPAFFRFLGCTVLLLFLMIGRQNDAGKQILEVFDGILPVYIVYFSQRYLLCLRGLRPVLLFLGSHSMNMFLTHTLIRTTFFQDFSYSFGNAWINVLVLLGITIVISITIEHLKKLLHFQQIVNHFLPSDH